MLDDGERGLAVVVVEDERVGGSAAAPRLADGTAAEYTSLAGSRTRISSTTSHSGRSSKTVSRLLSAMLVAC